MLAWTEFVVLGLRYELDLCGSVAREGKESSAEGFS